MNGKKMKLSDLYKEVYRRAMVVGDAVTAYKCIFRISEELSYEQKLHEQGIEPCDIEFPEESIEVKKG